MNSFLKKRNEIFENLFILELANNHWGSLERGLKIIRDHATVIRYNNVKAAIKLQFRDVEEFVHKDFKGNQDIRYIKKTEDTKLSKADFARMVEEIRKLAAIPMATPFDERSVDLCVEFGMPIIKIASSDIADWPLIEKNRQDETPGHRLDRRRVRKESRRHSKLLRKTQHPAGPEPLCLTLPIGRRRPGTESDRLSAPTLSRPRHRFFHA